MSFGDEEKLLNYVIKVFTSHENLNFSSLDARISFNVIFAFSLIESQLGSLLFSSKRNSFNDTLLLKLEAHKKFSRRLKAFSEFVFSFTAIASP